MTRRTGCPANGKAMQATARGLALPTAGELGEHSERSPRSGRGYVRRDLINIETLGYGAIMAIIDLDKQFIGTEDYIGVAYFWHYDYRHFLRPASNATRRRVHSAFLKLGLDHAGISPEHERIVRQMTRRETERSEAEWNARFDRTTSPAH